MSQAPACFFCARAASDRYLPLWRWEVVEQRRRRGSRTAVRLPACHVHVGKVREGRLLLRGGWAFGLRAVGASGRSQLSGMRVPGSPRRSERWYLQQALGLAVEPARSEAERCVGTNPSGERCRHRVAAGKRLCARHELLRRHRLSVVDAVTGETL